MPGLLLQPSRRSPPNPHLWAVLPSSCQGKKGWEASGRLPGHPDGTTGLINQLKLGPSLFYHSLLWWLNKLLFLSEPQFTLL